MVSRQEDIASTQRDPRVLLIIPAYNEEDSILQTVQEVEKAGYDYVVVNDGSTDSTLSLCRANGVRIIDLPINLGIGGAVQTGHKYAQANDYDIDIQFDGDGQHDIAYVDALVKAIQEGNDLAIGSRFLDSSSSEFKSTFMRRAGIVWLSKLIKLVCGIKVNDPTSGFRASGRRAIDLFCKSYPIDYPEPESIVEANKSGLQIAETAVSMNERQGGTSSINMLAAAYYMIKVTLSILITGLRKRS